MDKYIQDRGLKVQVLPPIQAPISSAVEEEISNRAVRPLEDFFVNGEIILLSNVNLNRKKEYQLLLLVAVYSLLNFHIQT
jgi:hypothetical protein